ncbi:MAG: hypothetical protein Q7T05_08470 [Dehalococcoidia bacterium]|nr:hypothetical protein [Dehalococcoidia bacterium]
MVVALPRFRFYRSFDGPPDVYFVVVERPEVYFLSVSGDVLVNS